MRHVGEPVAMVVAESRYVAEDAVGDIVVEYEPLPAVVDLEAALAAGSAARPRRPARQHRRRGAPGEGRLRRGARERRPRRAPPLHLRPRRSIPMETRGVVAELGREGGPADGLGHDPGAGRHPQRPRRACSACRERQVRVIAPFIGGGFGPKIMMFYPEEVLVPWWRVRLDRPVKWIEDRLEHFIATTQERGQVHEAEIALDAEGRILGVRDELPASTPAPTTPTA